MKPISLQIMLVTALTTTVGVQGQVPAIIKAPQGTSVLVGSTINLSVQGSSTTPLTYQWLFNSNAIPAATAQTYSLANIHKANEGDYQVVLSNNSGSVTSVVASVNVVIADIPAITNALVAHFTFEGNYNDVSGNGNSGSGVGSPGYTETGKCGGAGLHFLTKPDGSEFDFVALGTPDDFTFGASTDFSLSFWFRYTTPTGEFPLLANKGWGSPTNQGWGIAAGADGRLRWNLAGPPSAAKGYDGVPGALTNGVWHHIAVTFERAGNATTYLDGAIVDVQSLAASSNDVTTPAGLALNIGQDGTGTYTGGGTAGIDAGIDDLGLWRRALTTDEVNWIFAKGARGANIEQNVFDLSAGQATRVSGQWDFDNSDLKATVGQDLEYGDGPGGFMSGQTSFNTTTGFGIPDIGGAVAKVMKYTRSETPPDNYVQGYTMHHGIAPNGGGTLVNQWTLITDVLYPDLHQGDQYSAFIEIQNSTDSDADLAVHEESPGVGGIGISGRYPGNLTQGQWHRVAFAVDMAANPGVISKFIDGVKAADQTDADGRGLDGRFSLSDVAHLFSDGGHDNEVNTYYVNSVQIRDSKLADSTIAALGGPQASGIPGGPAILTRPTLFVARSADGKSLTISWDTATTGFTLESTASLANPNWVPVPGVVNNSVVVSTTTGTQLYRLKQ
jgi:hypothetical protein